MTLDDAATEIAQTIRRDAPTDAELVGVILAELARVTAARDALWIEYRDASTAYRAAIEAPRNRRMYRGTRDPALERIDRARSRRDRAARALGVEP